VSVIFTSPTGEVAKYCDEYVWLSACLSVCPREYLRNHTRDLYQIFGHVAYVRGSVLLRHVDDRPHGLWAGRGDGSAQRGRSVVYDCLVLHFKNIKYTGRGECMGVAETISILG